ncbi:MAG: hypothetical protein IKQ23_05450 [Treponema sp.]|nr:hypothetical protein [Treponema sp.]
MDRKIKRKFNMEIEDIIAKVLARYDSQVIYDIIQAVSIYREPYSILKLHNELIDININAIKYIIKPDEEFYFKTYDGYQKEYLDEFFDILNSLPREEYRELRNGLNYLVDLYKHKDDYEYYEYKHKKTYENKNKFRIWLIEYAGYSRGTANAYVNGVNAAQKHYFSIGGKTVFFDSTDIRVLREIFNKYIYMENIEK